MANEFYFKMPNGKVQKPYCDNKTAEVAVEYYYTNPFGPDNSAIQIRLPHVQYSTGDRMRT